MVAQVADVPADRMRCVLERYYNELKLLLVPTKTLKSEGFVRSNKVFIECSHQENDITGSFVDSRFYKLLDRYENTIRIYISLPPFDTADSPSAVSKSPSSTAERPTVSNKSPDVDEGIDDNGSDIAVADEEDLQKLKDGEALDDETTGSSSGPLRSHSLSSSDKQANVHAYISETISHNLTKDNDTSPTNDSSTSSAAHPASPDDTKVTPTATETQPRRDSTTIPCSEDWEMEAAMAAAAISDDDEETETVKTRSAEDDEYSRYFTGSIHIDAETGDRNLTVYVDKRITFGAFKKELEPYVCASSDYFRVYRVYGSNQEIETVRLSDTLSAFGDDNKLVVKLGRALKKGEQRVKVCLLTPKEQEPWKTLLETIFPKGITVLESKKIVIHEARVQCNLNMPIDRCRLRKKTYKNPGGIYLDNNTYEESSQVISFFEIFLEILDEPEKMTLPSQLQLYVRQWFPSQYKLGEIQETVLDKQTSQHLKQKLSELSGIPAENIDFAKGMGVFPYEVSLLDVHSSLDWSAEVASLGMWPLHIYEDGNLIYFRDKTEELAELDEARKKELTQSENTRLSRINTKVTYSPRKEKALKIYTDEPPSPSPTSSTTHLDVD